MDFTNIFVILLSSILVNNFVMSRFLGCCPFLGVSKKINTALGMGAAVTFVMSLASVITYLVQYFVLEPLGVAYLQTIAFILVIAALVQLVEMVIQKMSPSLYKALGASRWPSFCLRASGKSWNIRIFPSLCRAFPLRL